jgi:choline dehydrogenase-like flavoprotein
MLSFSATKKMFQLLQTEPFKSNVAAPFVPSSIYTSDADITNFINGFMTTSSHPIGTASMGLQADGGVVDTNLKVYGTTNVRVADASVIPLQVAAHTQATVYGVAERVSPLSCYYPH